MEELNKTQIILLAIFITFVTSVATGVVVVTLMDQAPQGVTQTVNRVVERTVERVISPGKVEKTEVKQIVREDDTVVSSVKTVKDSLVRVFRRADSSSADTADTTNANGSQIANVSDSINNTELALGNTVAISDEVSRVGFIVSGDGLIITSNEVLGWEAEYYALSGDTKYELKFIKSDDDAGISLFSIEPPEKGLIAFKALSIEEVSLGQTVMSLGLDSELDTLALGYVSGLNKGSDTVAPIIKTNIRPTENWSGRPLIDINGFLIGMYGANNHIIPYSTIKNLIDSSLLKVSLVEEPSIETTQ